MVLRAGSLRLVAAVTLAMLVGACTSLARPSDTVITAQDHDSFALQVGELADRDPVMAQSLSEAVAWLYLVDTQHANRDGFLLSQVQGRTVGEVIEVAALSRQRYRATKTATQPN